MSTCHRTWLLTWTTYGTWLPGVPSDELCDNPHVAKRVRHNTPGTPVDRNVPELLLASQRLLKGKPIFLQLSHASALLKQFQETAAYRGWSLIAVAIMRAHIHVVVQPPGDPNPDDLLRDFKAYGSRTLNREFARPVSDTWWTEGGSKRIKKSRRAIVAAVRYVANQSKPL